MKTTYYFLKLTREMLCNSRINALCKTARGLRYFRTYTLLLAYCIPFGGRLSLPGQAEDTAEIAYQIGVREPTLLAALEVLEGLELVAKDAEGYYLSEVTKAYSPPPESKKTATVPQNPAREAGVPAQTPAPLQAPVPQTASTLTHACEYIPQPNADAERARAEAQRRLAEELQKQWEKEPLPWDAPTGPQPGDWAVMPARFCKPEQTEKPPNENPPEKPVLPRYQPSKNEVETVARESGLNVNIDSFFDYYTLQDWKFHGTPFTRDSLLPALRMWQRRERPAERAEESGRCSTFNVEEAFAAATARTYAELDGG